MNPQTPLQILIERLDSYAETVAKLPDKFIDTRVILLVQLLICLICYSSIQAAQLTIVDRCIVPIPSSFIK